MDIEILNQIAGIISAIIAFVMLLLACFQIQARLSRYEYRNIERVSKKHIDLLISIARWNTTQWFYYCILIYTLPLATSSLFLSSRNIEPSIQNIFLNGELQIVSIGILICSIAWLFPYKTGNWLLKIYKIILIVCCMFTIFLNSIITNKSNLVSDSLLLFQTPIILYSWNIFLATGVITFPEFCLLYELHKIEAEG
jgi:hypothetical protein